MQRVVRSTIIDAPVDHVWAVLRDFNSHVEWHPIIAESVIERGEPPDQVGCVRAFSLKSGDRIREQLIALDDDAYVSTYCILDATVPLERYVATITLKPVTDGHRTFWHWESTFDAPRGRERELAEMVARDVYEGGFEALRQHLARLHGPTPSSRGRASGATGAAIESTVVRYRGHGGPEVMIAEADTARPPGAGEVRLRHDAIGVNYLDVYMRNGLYGALAPAPAVPGVEGAGRVIDVGPGVTHLLAGDRVAYAALPAGAYASIRTMPAESIVRLPDAIDAETAAGAMLKGLTAEYLLHRTCRVQAGDVILVHAAAGGVGLLLCQWARHLRATVIGTVSTEDKARIARAAGCEHPVVTRDYRFAEEVLRITSGRGVDVIYDGLGVAAVEQNLASLAPCGRWVSYGQASGPIASISPEALTAKSLSFSRPVLFHYTASRVALDEMSERLFGMIAAGSLRVRVDHRYPLAEAAEAHRALEGRRTTGSVVLVP